jgi:hypothetical protein
MSIFHEASSPKAGSTRTIVSFYNKTNLTITTAIGKDPVFVIYTVATNSLGLGDEYNANKYGTFQQYGCTVGGRILSYLDDDYYDAIYDDNAGVLSISFATAKTGKVVYL